jgi:hypothetical protein
MLMALGRCSGLFSEGVAYWDETGQCCHWRIIPIFPFENVGACWFLYVSTILWLPHRDCRIFIVRAWCSECVHTLDLSILSHPKDASRQPQVIRRLKLTRKSLFQWCSWGKCIHVYRKCQYHRHFIFFLTSIHWCWFSECKTMTVHN